MNTWWGFGSVFVLGISHGGPVTLIYGMILLSLVYGATALSLAELSAHYPTAGGQYHWTSLLAPKRLKRILVSVFTDHWGLFANLVRVILVLRLILSVE